MMKIVCWKNLTQNERTALLQRTALQMQAITSQTFNIINEVKQDGDEALKRLTAKYDKANIDNIAVTEQEFIDAYQNIDEGLLAAIRFNIKRIKAYNQAQFPNNWVFNSQDGIICGRQARAIDSVGLYVPGGTAPLVSTVMMLAIPALVAGCQQRVLCTPPTADGTVPASILVTAKECEIDFVYKVGGAQAIAAMAYGTQTVPKVDKIFGPGNQWVTVAKQLCAQNAEVSIDLPAGPSELLIIADESANPNFVAADLLSQAEHDKVAQVFLVTTSEAFGYKVKACLLEQLKELPRYAIASSALANSKIILVENINDAFEVSNLYAPEHLSIQLQNSEQYLSQVNNAGTVFLGDFTAEALGDYNTGANHVLPTAGFTRSYSGLSVLDFMKWIGYQQVSSAGLQKIGRFAAEIAKIEGLGAHENAVNIRLNEVNALCEI